MTPGESLLRALARLVPKELRERVFEPALADLLLDERDRSQGAWARVVARVVLVAECARIAAPQLVWRRGRPTRLAAALVVMIGAAALVVQRMRYR